MKPRGLIELTVVSAVLLAMVLLWTVLLNDLLTK
jgi:hypothetical protein